MEQQRFPSEIPGTIRSRTVRVREDSQEDLFSENKNFYSPGEWKNAPTWKEYAKKAYHWAWNPERKAWLHGKRRSLQQLPFIISEAAQFLVFVVGLISAVVEFGVVAPIVITGAVLMSVYWRLSNSVLDLTYNFFSGFQYSQEHNNFNNKLSLFFWERIQVLGKAMWHAVVHYWPRSLAGTLLHLLIIKPIQVVMFPVLMSVALVQELLLSASVGIALTLAAIPVIVPTITYFAVKLVTALISGLLSMCCCFKKNGHGSIASEEHYEKDSPRGCCNVTRAFSRAPTRPKALEPNYNRSDQVPYQGERGFRASVHPAMVRVNNPPKGATLHADESGHTGYCPPKASTLL